MVIAVIKLRKLSRQNKVGRWKRAEPIGEVCGAAGRKDIWAVSASGGIWLLRAKGNKEKRRLVLAIDEELLDDTGKAKGEVMEAR